MIAVVVLMIGIPTSYRVALAPTLINEPLTPHLRIKNLIIPVDIARTPAEVHKGLSGRPSLAADRGMLFIFFRPAIYRFWMPDMRFSLDIIWIADTVIVGIAKNVSNDFDPKKPRFYTPPKPITRVLEVNAGFAEKNNLRVGDTIIFKYTE